jgi:hypothetical protein
MLSADDWNAQLEADLIAEKWDDDLRGFAPWNELGPLHQDVRDRCFGVMKEKPDLTDDK